MLINITKKTIEEEIGYEINDFSLEPLYEGDECIGLNVKVEPKNKPPFFLNVG